MTITITGIDTEALRAALDEGFDHGNNPIEPFVDVEGGSPMRCCLRDSAPGDMMAIIAWSPFPWRGPYAELGPIFVHASGCPGEHEGALPTEMDARPMVLRPYGPDQKIAYHHVRHLTAEESTTTALRELLAKPDVAFVHGRNLTGGCFAFHAELT